MKLFVLALVAASLVTTHAAVAGDTQLPESDATTTWTYPYKADASKEKRIRDGVEVIYKDVKVNAPPSRVIEILGAPDQVTDLSKDTKGISNEEKDKLASDQFRQPLKKRMLRRMIWYIAKNGPGHSADDIWFAAYIGLPGYSGVREVLRNNFTAKSSQ